MTDNEIKKQRRKKWLREHKEDLFIGAIAVTLTGLTIVATVFTIKDENKRIAEYNAKAKKYNAWLNEKQSSGQRVLTLADGRSLVTDYSTPLEFVSHWD